MKWLDWPKTGKSPLFLQAGYVHLLKNYGKEAAMKYAFHNGIKKPRIRVKAVYSQTACFT